LEEHTHYLHLQQYTPKNRTQDRMRQRKGRL